MAADTADIHWEQLISIDPAGTAETYDLHVEEDHTFLANDLVVHNSHAASFALIAYATAWMRYHYPVEFTCGILNAWPMGFYSPATLIDDARRHGVEVRAIDVTASDWFCTLEPLGAPVPGGSSPVAPSVLPEPKPQPLHGVSGSGETVVLERRPEVAFAVRVGLRYVKGLGEEEARRLLGERAKRPFASVADLRRRARIGEHGLSALAECGAFERLTGAPPRAGKPRRHGPPGRARTRIRPATAGPDGNLDPAVSVGSPGPGPAEADAGSPAADSGDSGAANRRQHLWQVYGTARIRAADGDDPLLDLDAEPLPALATLDAFETISWDYRASGHSTEAHPLESFRSELERLGLPDAAAVRRMPDDRVASYAGLVICRQRPGTAGGVVFMTLEDETGFVNLVVWQKIFARFRTLLLTTSFLGASGRIQSKHGVVHLIPDRFWRPELSGAPGTGQHAETDRDRELHRLAEANRPRWSPPSATDPREQPHPDAAEKRQKPKETTTPRRGGLPEIPSRDFH